MVLLSQVLLVSKLKNLLNEFDECQKRAHNEELRRQRLAYVSVSMSNVLPEEKKKKKKRAEDGEDDDDDDESGSESDSDVRKCLFVCLLITIDFIFLYFFYSF